MGLDITAYRKVEEVRPVNKDDDDDGYDENLTKFYPNPDFRERFEGLKNDVLYSYEEAHGFRAGSYGGYSAWREWLAKLAGYPLTAHRRHGQTEHLHSAACWAGATGPFAELINFSDCEGAIGPVVAAKLAKDFSEWEERAKAATPEGTWYFDNYKHWRKAFEMAADSGAVDFH